MVERMYFSREQRISDIHREEERVDYTSAESDGNKLADAMAVVNDKTDELEKALEEYFISITFEGGDEEDQRDAYMRILAQRRELVTQWAYAQAALSKLAWILRVDGNEAYQRLIKAIQNGEEVDMGGL